MKLNKIIQGIGKVILSILAGIDVIFSVGSPILLALLILSVSGFKPLYGYIFLASGILASFFRAIKIGFMR